MFVSGIYKIKLNVYLAKVKRNIKFIYETG